MKITRWCGIVDHYSTLSGVKLVWKHCISCFSGELLGSPITCHFTFTLSSNFSYYCETLYSTGAIWSDLEYITTYFQTFWTPETQSSFLSFRAIWKELALVFVCDNALSLCSLFVFSVCLSLFDESYSLGSSWFQENFVICCLEQLWQCPGLLFNDAELPAAGSDMTAETI